MDEKENVTVTCPHCQATHDTEELCDVDLNGGFLCNNCLEEIN